MQKYSSTHNRNSCMAYGILGFLVLHMVSNMGVIQHGDISRILHLGVRGDQGGFRVEGGAPT